MTAFSIRPVRRDDFDAWLPLWRGYQTFYKVDIPEATTRLTFARLTGGQEPMGGCLARDAGRAVGLKRGRILQLVVLPQAMRVITPLITSTYLDLTKDTTLGVLIGYTELTAVIKTSANNTGNAVETLLVLVLVFLSISLPVSAAINAYNRVLARRGVASS